MEPIHRCYPCLQHLSGRNRARRGIQAPPLGLRAQEAKATLRDVLNCNECWRQYATCVWSPTGVVTQIIFIFLLGMKKPSGATAREGRGILGCPCQGVGLWGASLGGECHGDGCNVFIISSPLLLEITRVSVSWGRSLPPGQCGKCLINTMAATIPTTLAVLLLLLSLLLLPLQPFSCRVHISNCWTLRMFCLHSSLSPTLHVHLQAEYFDVQCSGASE